MLSANQHLLESIVSRILSSTLSLSAVIVTTVDDRVFRICVLCATIVTRCFFYMKTVKIKVIQNFMEITFYIKTYSKRTCWKKFFKFKFWLFFVDIWRRIWLQAMATRQQPPTNQNKNIVSKIETENKMLNNIFQQVFSEKQLKQRVISIKFWITFILTVVAALNLKVYFIQNWPKKWKIVY